MTTEIAYVSIVLVLMAVLLALERLRMDVVGFLTLSSLLFGGVLTVPEALSGFSDPTVHMIAGLFVVGGGIFQTGLADRMGQLVGRLAGGDARKLLLMIMLATTALSAFLSSTGTVAVMFPVVATLARRANISPSLLMIPLAYATLLGGMLTLIATPPNVVVSNALAQAGHEPFGFFSFTGPGLCMLALGLAFIVVFAPRLLPVRGLASARGDLPSARELWARYELGDWIFELQVQPGSPLIGRTIAESAIRSRFGVGVFAIKRATADGHRITRAQADHAVHLHDHLTVKGMPEAVERFCEAMRLREVSRPTELPTGLLAAELLLPPGSSFIGKTVAQTRLRSRYDVNVMAVYRSNAVMRESVANTVLSVGDLLLVVGTGKALRKLRDERKEAILVTETEELRQAEYRSDRAPHALLILVGMLLVMALELTPPVVAVIGAALGMVLCGCLDAQTADKTLNWESILLLATVLPLATALTKTGAIALLVDQLVAGLGAVGPRMVMTALFALAALVGVVISNTATAVLLAPVALQIATRLELAPHPLMMTLAIASSSSFLTPVSSPVNMLVMNAGQYRFADFSRLGAPLILIIWAGTLLVVPWFFPFAP